VIIDPPFRWFAARDVAEQAITDENYAATGRFFAEVPQRLRPGGRGCCSSAPPATRTTSWRWPLAQGCAPWS
jgi:hypothetical protein